jgi:hypothetical protein
MLFSNLPTVAFSFRLPEEFLQMTDSIVAVAVRQEAGAPPLDSFLGDDCDRFKVFTRFVHFLYFLYAVR